MAVASKLTPIYAPSLRLGRSHSTRKNNNHTDGTLASKKCHRVASGKATTSTSHIFTIITTVKKRNGLEICCFNFCHTTTNSSPLCNSGETGNPVSFRFNTTNYYTGLSRLVVDIQPFPNTRKKSPPPEGWPTMALHSNRCFDRRMILISFKF